MKNVPYWKYTKELREEAVKLVAEGEGRRKMGIESFGSLSKY